MLQYKTRIRQGILIPLCLAVLLLPALLSHADEISSLENRTNDLQSQLAGINADLLAISGQIEQSKEEIIVSQSEIARTDDQLKEALAAQEEQYAEMKARIKYMYENGNNTLLEWLCSSQDIGDFLNKAHFISDVSEYDKKMLESLEQTAADIADKKELLQTQQDELQKKQAGLQEQETQLKDKAAATSTDLADFQAKLAAAREAEAQRIAMEEAKRQEEARRAKAAADAAAHSQGGNSGSASQVTVTGNPVDTGSSHQVSADDRTLLAAILECEAYQDYNSLLAVATVIMNRMESSRFKGQTVSEIVYAPGQFEPVTSGRLSKVLSKGPTSLSMQVADDALAGKRLDAVSDCYYFLYAPAAGGRAGTIIGDNLFFQHW